MELLAQKMSFLRVLVFWCLWTATARVSTAAAWVTSPSLSTKYSHSGKNGCVTTPISFALRSSYNENDEIDTQEYRSIADVVGGLHGGKYQFGGGTGGIPDTAFSGHGGTDSSTETNELDEELPTWVKRLAPTVSQTLSPIVLSVPSNSNPMDGMVYFASIEIQNQERTWEKFYAKIMTKQADGFVELDSASPVVGLSVAPRSGSLAPRGGASNACDASQPYSDSATIRVTQAATGGNTGEDLWLVVGTEEEKWAYKLKLVEN